MLRKQISKEQIELLAEEVRKHVDPELLERGLEYQQKGLVYNAAVHERRYTSKVQGSQVYDVSIDLDRLPASHCSCGADAYCEHMAAAFFYAYAVYGRPDQFLRQIKPDVDTAGNRIDQSSLHRITAMLSPVLPAGRTLREKDGPEAWDRYIEDSYRGFAKANVLHKAYPSDFLTAFLQKVQQPATWWETPNRQLFQLKTALFALRQTDALLAELPQNAPSRTSALEKAAKACIDKLQQTLKELSSAELAETALPHLLALAEDVRTTLLRHIDGVVDGLFVYRFLWSRFLQHHGAADREIGRLEQAIREAEPTDASPGDSRRADRLRVALAHFDVLGKRDARATERLGTLERIKPADFLGYLHTFSQGRHTDRLRHWLQWLAPAMEQADAAELNLYCDYWIDAFQQGAPEEEVRRSLAALLPRSYAKYTAFLMQTGCFREWIEFHLAYGISPLSISPLDLKRLEEQRPDLLLPLYHQAVERIVAAKSRDAYKQAAYLLRKLKVFYEANGSSARFQDYMRRLASRYARLRAFQEELRKGKLLT